MEYREPYLPTTGDICDVETVMLGARGRYWPGQDYPDREVWLAKRYTPPRNYRAFMYFDSTRWGTLNMGVNEAKRKVRAEQPEWDKRSVRGLLPPANSPLRRQLMTIRRKAQTQGFVTIEPDAASQAQREQKRRLRP